MDQIIIEGVRCFSNRLSAPLKPITLLIGENSTGKTTFLALSRIAWDICQGPLLVDFNEEPFLLGAYHQIASYRGGRTGRARCLLIGAHIRMYHSSDEDSLTVPKYGVISGCFAREEGQPKLKEWTFEANPFRLEIKFGGKKEYPLVVIKTPSGILEVKDRFLREPFNRGNFFSYLSFFLSETADRISEKGTKGTMPSQVVINSLREIILSLRHNIGLRPYAFAPIRTRPQRTYDLLRDIPVPEGSHVPMILAKSYSSDPTAWNRLRKSLDSFGKTSGLFSDVEVRRMGREESAPFQIRVKVSGPAFNLVDVGYGVSQVLPIIVDILREQRGSTFLLQQPEVHLHPKAQAELGSFLALLAKQQNKRFLIETHSDYLVDRIRMDVRDKKHNLTPEDVAILYFERKNGSVKIHHLQIDESGNLKGAPSSYRRFFLDEEKRLLLGG